MGTLVIVILSPVLDARLRIFQRHEVKCVETFVSQATVEAFDKCVFRGLPGPNEVQLHAPLIGPGVECLRRKFGSMIDRDGFGERS